MQSGDIIGGTYVIESQLGTGGCSEVFIAEDASGRFALKVLRNGLDRQAELSDTLQEELRSLLRLKHPRIAAIHGYGFDPKLKQWFLAYELVEGQDIFTATEGKTIDEIVHLFAEVFETFHYLHSRHVHHLDVKACNILATEQSCEIKVIDYGLSTFGPGGGILGTPSYMAPEVLRHHRPDARCDLYSLGVLFYYCLTRWNPFRNKTVAKTLENQKTLIAPPPSAIEARVPREIDEIVMRLLEKNPETRYQSSRAVLEDLLHLNIATEIQGLLSEERS